MKKYIKSLFMLCVALLFLVGCSSGGGSSEESANTEESATEESTAGSSEEADREESSAEEESEESTDGGDAVTLQMLSPGYDEGYLQAELDAAIAKFEEENPNIKVEIVSAGWDELNSKIVQLYQAGEAPDLMMAGSRSIRQFAEQGVLEDLGPYMTDEFKDTRLEQVMESAQVGGTQYGIPLALSSRALFYRTDLIEEPPTTWEELLQTAQQVSEEHDMYGFAIPTDIGNGAHEIMNFIYQNEGRMVDDNGDFTVNSAENVETLDFLASFNEQEGVIPNVVETDREEQATMFSNGDLAMFVTGSWEKENLDATAEEAPYGVVELPAGSTKAVNLVTDSYLMSSISEHKEEAWKFIEFMGTEDIQRSISEAYNWMPVLKAEVDDERFQTDFMKPFLSIMEHGVAEPQVPNWDQFNESFLIAVQRAVGGEASAQEALDTAQEEVSQ